MHADLQTLLELQQRDKTVQQFRDELAALDPEIAELDSDLGACQERLDTTRKTALEAGEYRTELEEKIEEFKQLQARKHQKLEWVRGAKEAATLMAELDLGKSVLAKEEADWVRSADKVQEAELRAAEAEKAVQETKDKQAARREEIAAVHAEAQTKISAAEAERTTVAAGVSKPLLTQYDRIRKGRAPFAVYALHGDACGHCYTAVPKHRRQELLNGGRIITCEGCGVMIYEEAAPSE